MNKITIAGGNLFAIAAQQYGDATAWLQIARANGLSDPFLSGLVTLVDPALRPDAIGRRCGPVALAYLIDTSAPGPAARIPRARVLIGGQPLAGLETAYVESTGYYRADTFAISLALDADPASTPRGGGRRRTCGSSCKPASQRAGQPPAMADRHARPGGPHRAGPRRRAVLLNGRDLACLLIDAKTTETFVNQSAAQVASVLAPRHGLTANCSSPAAPVGQFYQVEHSRQTLATGHSTTTEWDLLVRLAKQDGADLWVSGTTLNLQPQAVPTPATSILLAHGSHPRRSGAIRPPASPA